MELSGIGLAIRFCRVGKTMKEKERGRRKSTDRAKKWREWALRIRFDSERTAHRFRVPMDEGKGRAMEGFRF